MLIDPYTVMVVNRERCDLFLLEALCNKRDSDLGKWLTRAAVWLKQRIEKALPKTEQLQQSTSNAALNDLPFAP